MEIEKLKLNVTLKCGDKVYSPGEYNAPIPRDLIDEARAGARTIDILAPAFAKDYHKIVIEEREKEVESFMASWMGLEATPFKTFIEKEENRNIITGHGQIERAKAKWYRIFPSFPFPDIALKDEVKEDSVNEVESTVKQDVAPNEEVENPELPKETVGGKKKSVLKRKER